MDEANKKHYLRSQIIFKWAILFSYGEHEVRKYFNYALRNIKIKCRLKQVFKKRLFQKYISTVGYSVGPDILKNSL